jgi:hypothetical protein
MIGDKSVDASEGLDGFFDESAALFGRGEVLFDGDAVFAELGGEGFGGGSGAAVVKGDACAGLMKEADGGGSDAARASGDEDGFAFERERD